MKSSPTSRASTGLCKWTFGNPGMLPNKTSSMEGCSAAVTETESPSQLRPAVNQTICTSLTDEGWREHLEVEAILEPPNALRNRCPGGADRVPQITEEIAAVSAM